MLQTPPDIHIDLIVIKRKLGLPVGSKYSRATRVQQGARSSAAPTPNALLDFEDSVRMAF
ncbi:hypothetical protein IVA95_28150 [Bradyrhizobium sp. 157]|uniref:hypothetical protein n=1 Tax=Bradyrhizobium sp. 157 TaxID=2782631 RepID=UPI001FFA507A|nr:hypothetical protein [Bradyrhizobium sp. 157]MCK1641344.1 hypothetical protein [Bradyrhizobium sp. 157]